MESTGAVGQADIRQYYDSLHLLRVFRFLVDQGVPIALATACIRHQLLCRVRIRIGPSFAIIVRRTLGSLTGSRLAGMAARVPILHMCHTRVAVWKQYGFSTPCGKITMSTFVDNLYVAGKSCYTVSKILDDAEDFLCQTWELRIKPTSRAILAPVNCVDVSVIDERKWPVVTAMKVLGHCLQNDGGIDACFDATVQSMWRAFYGNCVGVKTSRMSVKSRLALVSRTVTPILRYKWTRWPFTCCRAQRLDAIHRHMFGVMLRLERKRDESIDVYVRRRGRETGRLQKLHGSWSRQWAFGVVGWSEHLERERNSLTWAAMLSKLRTPTELAERRAQRGRPSTRSCSGYIRRRWHESIATARVWSQNST